LIFKFYIKYTWEHKLPFINILLGGMSHDSIVLGFLLLVTHLVLEVREKASLFGSSKFIDFVVIDLVFSKIGSLVVTSSLGESSSLG
jgi:hypothetical protein